MPPHAAHDCACFLLFLIVAFTVLAARHRVAYRRRPFRLWMDELQEIAASAGFEVTRDFAYWRHCFDDGLTPLQAWQKSSI